MMTAVITISVVLLAAVISSVCVAYIYAVEADGNSDLPIEIGEVWRDAE